MLRTLLIFSASSQGLQVSPSAGSCEIIMTWCWGRGSLFTAWSPISNSPLACFLWTMYRREKHSTVGWHTLLWKSQYRSWALSTAVGSTATGGKVSSLFVTRWSNSPTIFSLLQGRGGGGVDLPPSVLAPLLPDFPRYELKEDDPPIVICLGSTVKCWCRLSVYRMLLPGMTDSSWAHNVSAIGYPGCSLFNLNKGFELKVC